MIGIQKKRRKCSQDKASASAMDSRPASQENTAATAVDSRPASQENAAASALQENASASALDSRPVSSFEFSVTSEEGINLYVDMNSSLVDWHKRMENGMCVCRCLEENKFQSFREQLLYLGNNRKQTKDSFGWKSDSRVKDGNASSVSSPNSFKEKSDNSSLNHLDAKNGPSDIFAAEACSVAKEESECLEEQNEHLVSSSSSLGVEGMILSLRPERIGSVDPNAFHVPQVKVASCSMESLTTDGSQTIPNDKNMKLHHEISTKIKIQMGRNTRNVTPLPVSSESVSPVNGTEASCKSEVMSDSGHKQKRYKSLFDKVPLQFSGRILRSAVRPRRSRRLVTKVVTP